MSKVFALNCPECGEDVFVRGIPEWFEDEAERCTDCGIMCMVRIDDSDFDNPVAWVNVWD